MPTPTSKTLKRAWAGVRLRAASVTLTDSARYWQRRYELGGTSGNGSYGEAASFKAEFLNALVAKHHVHRVIEFGCGDGNQLSLSAYPNYVGLDVARAAVEQCIARFADDETKSFFLYSSTHFADRAGIFQADLAMSLDVLFHLIEDAAYELHLRHLFAASQRLVAIFATNANDSDLARHVRHRKFSGDVARMFPEWELIEEVQSPIEGAGERFFIYLRKPGD